MSEADSIGWAIREADGNMNVQTVSTIPLGAMLKWVGMNAGIGFLNQTPDEDVERVFKDLSGAARLIKVSIIEVSR